MTKSNWIGASLGISALLFAAGYVAAQAPASSDGMTSPAQSVGLYVFAQKEQTPTAQLSDEQSCYGAAKTASGVDPAHLNPTTVAVNQSQGGAAKGTVGGAAGGAAIGAIAGDAGKGAAIGATVGLLHGARSQKKANAQAQQQATAQAAAGQQGQIDAFKRAMTACLESKNYSVK